MHSNLLFIAGCFLLFYVGIQNGASISHLFPGKRRDIAIAYLSLSLAIIITTGMLIQDFKLSFEHELLMVYMPAALLLYISLFLFGAFIGTILSVENANTKAAPNQARSSVPEDSTG